MRRDIFLIVLGFILMMLVALSLPGCVNAPIKLPEPKSCPTLVLDPIPQKVYLDVQGDKVVSDKGGDQVLRGYVACRSMYK
jgi:hypothetical protein